MIVFTLTLTGVWRLAPQESPGRPRYLLRRPVACRRGGTWASWAAVTPGAGGTEGVRIRRAIRVVKIWVLGWLKGV